MKTKIYCFINGKSDTDVVVIATVVKDGKLCALASHISSSVSWAKNDIQSNYKHKTYKKYFKEEEYEIEWVDDPKTHEVLKELI